MLENMKNHHIRTTDAQYIFAEELVPSGMKEMLFK